MNEAEIRAEFDKIISEDGPWIAHYFKLPGGLETAAGSEPTWDQHRAWFALRSAQLALQKPASALRVLDVGCLEGGMSIALAKAGCEVVGLDIREASLRKAQFVADALAVKNISFVKGDMLSLPALNLGLFDLIICAGTLYHIDAPDLLPFMQSLNAVCRGVVFLDTHICLEPVEYYQATSQLQLLGKSFVEHWPDNDKKAKLAKRLASADNNHAFWLTERSLANLAIAAGFAQIIRPIGPVIEWPWQDRGFWLAYSGGFAANVGVSIDGTSAFVREPDQREKFYPAINLPRNDAYPNPRTVRISKKD